MSKITHENKAGGYIVETSVDQLTRAAAELDSLAAHIARLTGGKRHGSIGIVTYVSREVFDQIPGTLYTEVRQPGLIL